DPARGESGGRAPLHDLSRRGHLRGARLSPRGPSPASRRAPRGPGRRAAPPRPRTAGRPEAGRTGVAPGAPARPGGRPVPLLPPSPPRGEGGRRGMEPAPPHPLPLSPEGRGEKKAHAPHTPRGTR